MSPANLIYADNWNFTKVYCSSSISIHQKKVAKPFSRQFKLTKELSIFKIRSTFAGLAL